MYLADALPYCDLDAEPLTIAPFIIGNRREFSLFRTDRVCRLFVGVAMRRGIANIGRIGSGRAVTLLVAGLAVAAAGCDGQQVEQLTPFSAQVDSANWSKVQPCEDVSDEERLVRQMIRAVNAEREKHNLRPLRANSTLNQIAEFYACRLVDGRFFTHIDPFDGSTVDSRAADFGYAFLKVGENLAASQRSVEQAMEDWMGSSSHRANILDPGFSEIGVAVKRGGDYGIYWVQEFGRPLSDDDTVDTGVVAPASQPASQPSVK